MSSCAFGAGGRGDVSEAVVAVSIDVGASQTMRATDVAEIGAGEGSGRG